MFIKKTLAGRLFIIILCVCTTANAVLAQNVKKAKLDSLFDELAATDQGMGSVAISKNGHLVYARAFGNRYISETEKIAATRDTKYRIASISKMFTTVMIFQLIEANKLSLSTTLDTYFPQLPNAKKITITQMLYHRSGLHNFITEDSWALGAKTEDELLSIFARSNPDFEPDEQSEYSNTNFLLLGYIIERITKKTYSEELQERIVNKLALKNTYYGGKTDKNINESFSYDLTNGKWVQYPETDMSILGGAGAILSTPTDMDKFIEALFAHKLISANSLGEMTTIKDEHGMGIFTVPFYEHSGYGHTGHIDGMFSTLNYFPGDSLAVAYCSNGHVYSLNDILIGILCVCLDKPYSIPDFKAIAAYKADDYKKYIGTYSSKTFPLKITISNYEKRLKAQATGQSAFPIDAIGKDKFQFLIADIEMDFNTDASEMTFKQRGHTHLFTRDKK